MQLTLVTFLPSQALSVRGLQTKCRQEMCNFFTNIAEGRRWLPLACLDGFYANRGDLLGFLLVRQLFKLCDRGLPFKKLVLGSPGRRRARELDRVPRSLLHALSLAGVLSRNRTTKTLFVKIN